MDLTSKLLTMAAGLPSPAMIIDRRVIREKLALIRESLPGARVLYAVKANPHPEVLRVLAEAGCGFEVAATSEFQRCIDAGVSPRRMVSSHPVKSAAFIAHAYDAGVREFAVDSANELGKLARLAPGSRVRFRLAVDNTGSEWPLGGKFGCTLAELPGLLREASRLRLEVEGFTFHVGSQCTRTSSWLRALDLSKSAFLIAAEAGLSPHVLNLGGGLPVRYLRPVPTIPEIAAVIRGFVSTELPEATQLEVEPGRALVGDAAMLVTEVIGKATREGVRWVYLDGGVYNCLMETLGGFGYRVASDRSGPTIPHTLGGPTCDAADVVMRDVEMPDLEDGDRVYFLDVGAYSSLSYSPGFGDFRPPRPYFIG